MAATTPVLVINMAKDTGRLGRVRKRLEHHRLVEGMVVIPAVEAYSEEKKVSEEIWRFIEGDTRYPLRPPVAGCLLSHLKALRYFVEKTEAEGVLIMEDDVMLDKNFTERFTGLLGRSKDPLILLAPYIINPVPKKENYLGPNLFRIFPHCWGTACYWISREYAKKCLTAYDRPLREYPGGLPMEFVTSELITMFSGGSYTFPPLVIEEICESNIQAPHEIFLKRVRWSLFGYGHYELPGESVEELWKAAGGPLVDSKGLDRYEEFLQLRF